MRRPGSPYKTCFFEHYYLMLKGRPKSLIFLKSKAYKFFGNSETITLLKFIRYKQAMFRFIANKLNTRKIVELESTNAKYVADIKNNIDFILNKFKDRVDPTEVIYLIIWFVNLSAADRKKELVLTSMPTVDFLIHWLNKKLNLESEQKPFTKYSFSMLTLMKVGELKCICRNNKIRGYSQKMKSDIIDLILKWEI